MAARARAAVITAQLSIRSQRRDASRHKLRGSPKRNIITSFDLWRCHSRLHAKQIQALVR